MGLRETIVAVRQERMAALLERQGWDAAVIYGNGWRAEFLRYVSDFGICEGHGVAIVTRHGVTLLVESPFEAERARTECPGVSVHLVGDIFGAVSQHLDGYDRVGAAPAAFMPSGLVGALPVGTADASALLAEILMLKAEAEVEAVHNAARMADEGYAVFRAATRPGRMEYEIIAEVEAFFRSRHCADHFVIIGAGGTEIRGMHPPNDRKVKKGDVVTTEITPSMDGYFAQLCRTLVVGEPTDVQRRAFSVYVDATEAGIAAVRAGVTAAHVAKAENDVFRARGLGEYTTSQYTRVRGHGLGLTVDGGPPILESEDRVLEDGMTIIVHPNTYHPDVGYIVLGDAVAVTKTGSRRLAATPLALFSVPA